jgi:signal transduction histidine kinase
MSIHLTVPPTTPLLTAAQEINIYRIIQEALQNAVKHSKASLITVDIRSGTDSFAVIVRDNGIGISLSEKNKPVLVGNRRQEGLGLRSMRYRAHQLGAEYRISSGEGRGTLVEVCIPLAIPVKTTV